MTPDWFYSLTKEALSLGDLIVVLEDIKSERGEHYEIRNGFANPHSYYGIHDCLGLEPKTNAPVSEMISLLKDCVGKRFHQYSVGKFEMDLNTPCYWASYGIANGVAITKERLLRGEKDAGEQMNISFAKTLDALASGKKTVTRRQYSERQIKAWQAAWDEGRKIHPAYSKVTFHGGDCIGWIELTECPYLERLGDMPQGDLEAEGGVASSVEEFASFIGCSLDDVVLVIRFVFIPFDLDTLYMPTSSDDGEWFMRKFCDKCTKETEGRPCEILAKTFAFTKEQKQYPRQWLYHKGSPLCISFFPRDLSNMRQKARGKKAPKNQYSLFDL